LKKDMSKERVEGAGGEAGRPDESSGGRRDQVKGASSASRRRKPSLRERVSELEEALEKAKAEAAENRERWLRSRADYENLKKRTARDIELAHQSAGRDLVQALLPALDNLDKAIEAARQNEALRPMEEGLALIHKGLMEALEASGVRVLDPLGEAFDPEVHEAVMQTASQGKAPGTIVQVLQKGYVMNGIVLRAAKVVVAGGSADEGRTTETRESEERNVGDEV